MILAIHNMVRWLVILSGMVVLALEYTAWLGQHEWKPANRLVGMIFPSLLDVQLLLGVILTFSLAPRQLGMMLSLHIIPMVGAVILAHVGSRMVKRSVTDAIKHRRAALWYSAAFFVVLMFIPWWRPLLPWL